MAEPGYPVLLDINGTVHENQTTAQVVALQRENTNVVYDQGDIQRSYIFPQPIDVSGFIFLTNNVANTVMTVRISSDTTDGYNGTWTDVTAQVPEISYLSIPGQRLLGEHAYVVNWTNVKAVSVQTTGVGNNDRWFATRIYAANQNLKLAFWNPTTDVDLGPDGLTFSVTQNGSTDTSFRIKNLTGYTFDAVKLNFRDNNTVETSTGRITASLGGGAFGALPLTIGTLAPNAISPVIIARYAAPLSSWLGSHEFNLYTSGTLVV